MNLNFENADQARKTHLRLLVEMSMVDNHLSANERRMIEDVAEKLAVEKWDLDAILENPSEVPFVLPNTEDERLFIFFHLLFLMKMDSQVKPVEEELCRKLGFKLGLSPLLVNDMIRVIKESVHSPMEPGALLKLVKTHRN